MPYRLVLEAFHVNIGHDLYYLWYIDCLLARSTVIEDQI